MFLKKITHGQLTKLNIRMIHILCPLFYQYFVEPLVKTNVVFPSIIMILTWKLLVSEHNLNSFLMNICNTSIKLVLWWRKIGLCSEWMVLEEWMVNDLLGTNQVLRLNRMWPVKYGTISLLVWFYKSFSTDIIAFIQNPHRGNRFPYKLQVLQNIRTRHIWAY